MKSLFPKSPNHKPKIQPADPVTKVGQWLSLVIEYLGTEYSN